MNVQHKLEIGPLLFVQSGIQVRRNKGRDQMQPGTISRIVQLYHGNQRQQYHLSCEHGFCH